MAYLSISIGCVYLTTYAFKICAHQYSNLTFLKVDSAKVVRVEVVALGSEAVVVGMVQ